MLEKRHAWDTLLYAAFVCMVLDHLAILLPQYDTSLRSVGRLAFPWFAWSLGHSLTRHREVPWNMLARMHHTGVVCVIPWLILLPQLDVLNIFYTLSLSVLVIALLEPSWKKDLRFTVAAWCIVAYGAQHVDYGVAGVLLPVAFYAVYRYSKESYGEWNTWRWVLALVLWLSMVSDYPWAWLSLPLGWLILRSSWVIPRIHPGMFYYGYALHVMALALASLMRKI